MTAATPPAPLEWHPAYRDQTWLLDWLEGRGGWPTDRIVLPIAPTARAFLSYDAATPVPEPLSPRTRVLTKQRAWGAAPYVGRPFIYWWYFATDELNRSIAGDARIRHASPDYDFCSGPAEYTSDARNGHDPDTPVWP